METAPNNSDEIRFVGVKDLTLEEQKVVNELSTHYFKKLKRLVHNHMSLQLMIKTYAKDGARKKYSINLRLTMPSKSLVSNKTTEWDLNKSLHGAYRGLMQEVQNKFRSDNQFSKAY